MAENVFERHYRDRVESVRQIALHEPGNGSLSWRDFEDLVALCADLAVSGRELLEQECQRLIKAPNLTVTWLRERRRVIEELSDRYVQVAEIIKNSAYQAWQAAGSPAGKDFRGSLDSAIQTITHTKERVLQRWPVGSDEEIAAAQAGGNRGEELDVDEAFAQIAGVDVETWRRRIEEYKRGRQG